MKILLTGGNGFIGKNLLEQLSEKYNFTAPSRYELDFLNPKKVKNFLVQRKFDLVIHAANIGGNRAQVGMQGVFEANKKMFLNLVENSGLFGRMIFLGSGAEYGKQQPIVKVKESDFGKVVPEDEYGKAKYFASEYIGRASNIINLRLFGVFGKYEDYATRFISNAIAHAIFDMSIIINQNVLFDYLYVNDLVKILEFFINNEPKEKFYNVGRGESIDLLTLAEVVRKTSGKNLEIHVKNPGFNKEYTCDNSLLRAEVQGLKFISFEKAIAEMYDWYGLNKANLDKSKL